MSGLILTGLYDSPFVRRAALALTFHGIEFEHRALSVFGDFDEVLKVNPLGRAPSVWKTAQMHALLTHPAAAPAGGATSRCVLPLLRKRGRRTLTLRALAHAKVDLV